MGCSGCVIFLLKDHRGDILCIKYIEFVLFLKEEPTFEKKKVFFLIFFKSVWVSNTQAFKSLATWLGQTKMFESLSKLFTCFSQIKF